MNTEKSGEILEDVFADRVDAIAPYWSGQVQPSFFEGYEDHTATATMTIFQDDEIVSSAQQPMPVLPSVGEVDPERYRAFAEGVRSTMGYQVARYEGMTGPAEFFAVDLLRDASLTTAADFERGGAAKATSASRRAGGVGRGVRRRRVRRRRGRLPR